jgi:hypothetical protein
MYHTLRNVAGLKLCPDIGHSQPSGASPDNREPVATWAVSVTPIRRKAPAKNYPDTRRKFLQNLLLLRKATNQGVEVFQ